MSGTTSALNGNARSHVHSVHPSNSAVAGRVIVLAAIGLCLAAPPAWTVDSYWVCGDGSWTDGTCWSATDGGAGGVGAPVSGENVYVTSNDIQDRTLSIGNGTDPILSSLHLDGTGSSAPTLQNGGAMLRATTLIIGDAGTGSYVQTAGGIVGVNNFILGSQAGAMGYFDVSDGTVSTNQHIHVGDAGSGYFTQTGGTVSSTYSTGSSLRVGLDSTYELSGTGILNTSNTFLGNAGGGLFQQWNGEHNITRNLYLGRSTGEDGTYELHDGKLTVGLVEYLGWVGDGHFIQYGGTHDVAYLYLGYDTNAYNSPPPTSVSTYDLHDGELHAYFEIVGARGESTFTQNDGTHVVDTELQIGGDPKAGGPATFNLNGGALSADAEHVGGYSNLGTFNHDGGDNTVRVVVFKAPDAAWTEYLATGDDSGFGTYNLNGGNLYLTGGTMFGQGHAVLNVDGGTIDIGGATLNLSAIIGLNVGNAIGSIGSFTMPNGHVDAYDETVGGAGAGTFTQMAGDHRVYRDLVIARDPGSQGTFNLSGGELYASRVQNNGTFNYTGGSLKVTGLADSAFVNGEAQPGGGTDPNALFNIENTTVTVIGDVINYGTIMVTDADVTFTSGTVTSAGGIVTDPSTLRFGTLQIDASGYIAAAAGDVFVISGDFVNNSERSDLWDTSNAALMFSGAGDHEFHLAEGADPRSFGWGTLELTDGAGLTMSGNTATGLFVASLVLGDGSMLDLNGADLLVHEVVDLGGSYAGGNVVIVPQTVPLPPAWALMLPAGVLLMRRFSTRET